MIIPIASPDDPRLEAYRDVRERDLVGRRGLFIAEGEVVLRQLAASTMARPHSLLVASQRIDALADVIARLPAETPLYAAEQGVIDAISGFPLHRGILALGERSSTPTAAELVAGLPDQALVVVLYGIGNHDNMGGLFRNAAAFGADAVLLDPTCCDPLYRKAIRVSVGGVLKVPFARVAEGEDAIALLQAEGVDLIGLSPHGSSTLSEVRPSRRTALILGSEGPGLPQAVLDRIRTVRIPMAGGFDSLNVATTSGIVLHHLKLGH